MAFICGNCKNRHDYVIEAQACYAGDLGVCFDLVWVYTEDGRETRECGAPAMHTEHGYSCAAGHSYVYAEVRVREGWEYAEDPREAYQLAKAGVFPMKFDGSGPSEIHPC